MEFNKQSGQISKKLIISAIIVFVIIAIVYAVIKFISVRKSETLKTENSSQSQNEIPEVPKPVYDATLGDVKFLLKSSQNLGNILKSPSSYEKDLVTTEKFIKVIIGTQNKGKNNIAQYSWSVGNVVDSEGRNFVSINNQAYSWLPKPDLCGALLKPEFEPIPCVNYYEVSKESTGLKIVVTITTPKKQESLIDLNLNPPPLPLPPPTTSLPFPSLLCNRNGVCDDREDCIICSPTDNGVCFGCSDCGLCKIQPP